MVKSREQFTEDVQIGNAWEQRLWEELTKYLPTLSPPRPAVLEDGLAVGGFQYTPDMKLTTMVHHSQKDAAFYGDCQVCVEAKVRLSDGFNFTGPDDFPFPDVIVTEVYKTAPAHIAPMAYIKMPINKQKTLMRPFHSYWIGSTDQRHVMVILPASKPLWTHKTLYSPKDGRAALNWMCPLKKPNGGPAVLFGRFPDDVPHLLTYL